MDFEDYAIFAQAWLTESGQEGWNSNCDIIIPPDDIIDMKDLAEFVEHWLDW